MQLLLCLPQAAAGVLPEDLADERELQFPELFFDSIDACLKAFRNGELEVKLPYRTLSACEPVNTILARQGDQLLVSTSEGGYAFTLHLFEPDAGAAYRRTWREVYCEDADTDEKLVACRRALYRELRSRAGAGFVTVANHLSGGSRDDEREAAAPLAGAWSPWFLHLAVDDTTLRVSVVSQSNQKSVRLGKVLLDAAEAKARPSVGDVVSLDDDETSIAVLWKLGEHVKVATFSRPPEVVAAPEIELTPESFGCLYQSEDASRFVCNFASKGHHGGAYARFTVFRIDSRGHEESVDQVELDMDFEDNPKGGSEKVRRLLLRHGLIVPLVPVARGQLFPVRDDEEKLVELGDGWRVAMVDSEGQTSLSLVAPAGVRSAREPMNDISEFVVDILWFAESRLAVCYGFNDRSAEDGEEWEVDVVFLHGPVVNGP